MMSSQVIQTAYVVPDLMAGCVQLHDLFGIGPFYRSVPVLGKPIRYRGNLIDNDLHIEIAMAKAGDIIVELICQRSAGPSAYRDVFESSAGGFHHVAVWTDDYIADVGMYRAAGYEIAMELGAAGGPSVCYVDTRSALGHMIELIPRDARLERMFAFVLNQEHDRGVDVRHQLLIDLPRAATHRDEK
jgi:hypothetical protein